MTERLTPATPEQVDEIEADIKWWREHEDAYAPCFVAGQVEALVARIRYLEYALKQSRARRVT
jgi:hypothetical protein